MNTGYAPNQQQIDNLLQYLNDQTDNPDYDAIDTFLRMARDIQKKILSESKALRKENETLKTRLDRINEKKTQSYEIGEFTDCPLGLRDTDIAQMVIYYLQLGNHKYRMSTVCYLIYLTYALFLTKGIRLCAERPQATSAGPWFWRVSNKMEKNLYDKVPTNIIKAIAEKDNSIPAIIRNIVEKYHDAQLSDLLKNSFPYVNADRDHNEGKWNKTIDDGQIFQWQKSRI